MKERPNGKFALQCPERRFGLSQLHILRPYLLGRLRLQVGAQQVGAFARLVPAATILSHVPGQAYACTCFSQGDFIEVVHRWMPSLNLPQSSLHYFTSTSGRTRVQSSFTSSASNRFICRRGVPTRYCPPRLRIAARFSSLTIPRSNIQILRAFPYLRSTMRRMVSTVETSARLPSNVS